MTAEVAWDSLLAQYDADDAFVAIVDDNFTLRAASPAIGLELALNPDDVIGKSTADLIHPDDILRALEVFRGNVGSSGLRPPNIYRIRTDADGVYRAFAVAGEPILDGGGMVLHLREPTGDARSDLRALEQIDIFEMMGNGRSIEDCLLALVVMIERNSSGTKAIVHIADEDGLLQPIASGTLSTGVLQRFRGAPADAPGGGLETALAQSPTTTEDREVPGFASITSSVAHRSDGTVAGFLEMLHPSSAPGGTETAAERLVCGLIGLLVDRYAVESRPTQADLLDSVTEFPNRRALQLAIEELDADDQVYGLLAIQIDDFSSINAADHEAGARALLAVARAIRAVLPEGAAAHRSSGDEFVVIVRNERRAESLAATGEAILEAIDEAPVDLGASRVRLGVSIGAAVPNRSQDFAALLGEADTAMCVAKRDGGHQVRIHDQPLDSRWVHRKALAESMPAAIESNELFLEYQPIISLNSHYVVGFEALTRWKHPRFGMLSPGDFLPIAEETSLM